MPPSIDRPPQDSTVPLLRFALTTLGKPEVQRILAGDVRERIAAIQLTHLAALTYVALSPGRMASRQVLATHLWCDSKDKDPRHGLRASLNVLRGPKGLGPDALTSGDRESIALVGSLSVD